MTVSAYAKARLEEELSGNGLSPLQNRALALLVESHLTLPQIAAELGINRQRLWEIRKDPDFQAAYRVQMAILESSALQYAIASRVERIAALNAAWTQVRDELAKRRTPRVDLTYAMVNLQQAAAKELGQDVQRVQIESHEQVRVIRFEAQAPRAELQEQSTIDAEFRDAEQRDADPPASDSFDAALANAGVVSPPNGMSPEHAARLKAVIAESGLDPASVLSREQFAQLYGEEHDPWTA